MNRTKWILWLILLGALVVVGLFAVGPLRPLANAIVGRVKLRERESAKRLEETKRRDAELAAKQTKSADRALIARAQASRAAARAKEIEAERETLATELAEEISDEERARRFRKRHGLSDPRDPSS